MNQITNRQLRERGWHEGGDASVVGP